MTAQRPLAERYRPETLDDIAGQARPVSIVRQMLRNNALSSMIFFGPPGCGKTTLAHVIAHEVNVEMHWLNATTASVKDLQTIVHAAHGAQTLVYLDEIQYWNKKQQQSLLSIVEDGSVILIAATTENPWHGLYRALLSRLMTIEFSAVPREAICERLTAVLDDLALARPTLTDGAVSAISGAAAGDVRRALTLLDECLGAYADRDTVDVEDVRALVPSMNMSGFDTAGDTHYALVSALQKSIRGSDPDAAVFYLMRFLTANDMVSPCRRLPAICCEDIGLADPYAIVHTMSCIEAAERLGFPECAKPLTEAVVYLALAPKSASNEAAWVPARADIEAGRGTTVPAHVASEHAPGYVWPQDHPDHWTPQQYLPDDLADRHYWQPQSVWEQERHDWWASVIAHHPEMRSTTT